MEILIIEDDPSIQMLLNLSLKVEGYKTIVVGTVKEGIECIKYKKLDIVLLDLTLPDGLGYHFLEYVREYEMTLPIIVLTAKNDMNDKILGFQLGADDYITKPFETRELIERIKAVMRRMKVQTTEPDCIRLGPIEINRMSRTLTLNKQDIKTTTKEFEFMWLLCSHPKKVFTREQILDLVWGYEYFGQTRSVDMVVNRLRDKFKPYDSIIATIHGTGYKLEVGHEASR